MTLVTTYTLYSNSLDLVTLLKFRGQFLSSVFARSVIDGDIATLGGVFLSHKSTQPSKRHISLINAPKKVDTAERVNIP